MLLIFLVCIGVYATLWYLHENLQSPVQIVVSTFASYFSRAKRKSLVERYGKWAVVTGATDGIGRQYARELAKHGMNIVLISRTESKLVEAAKEIESTHSVRTKYIVVDFGSGGRQIYDKIKQELQSLDVGVLINNVGAFHEFPDFFDHIAEDVLWHIMNVNVGAVTMMSRLIIPHMKANRRGIIVNVSSGTENQPLPLCAIYAASKIYTKNFTLALQHELAEHNVEVQLVSPMYVVTKMNNYAPFVMRGNFLVPDVESYTRFAVFTLGKTAVTTGYWNHGLQVAVMKLVPQFLRTAITVPFSRVLRDEYLQKKQKAS